MLVNAGDGTEVALTLAIVGDVNLYIYRYKCIDSPLPRSIGCHQVWYEDGINKLCSTP